MSNKDRLINEFLSFSNFNDDYVEKMYELINLLGGTVKNCGDYLNIHPIHINIYVIKSVL